ncbi:MAG: Electron transfer flavoprotein, beta subunit [Candidatus Aramenus sulfurataquae]|jgi:electron transfer flavoprotein beta subunit|uniref:Electron transfer flavoprotein subunit alpha n=2 Tax=Candidatus Aramenus sulfurataquae TaxID=1326980 RepID=W7L7L6_9CREN|nr:MAG: Electron transfer flavoprotein, beta subunit [Candidatus Aramenus sulfurataquae]MCL7343853.1 electron transfer flavoprotein subunit beta/FixA family protein [Candidatus Aramenus sulfurataquae]
MNIVVGFKVVPDESLIRVSEDKLLLDVPLKLNTYDKNAIEEAVSLKERNGGRAIGITVGAGDRKVIREALAMGLDEVIVVKSNDLDVYDTSMAISENVRGLNPDLIIFGEQTVDSGTTGVPRYVAELLGMPFVSNVRSFSLEGKKFVAERGMVSYSEKVEGELPAVISVGGEINTPRIPSVRQIMESSKKPVKEVNFSLETKVKVKDVKPIVVKRKRVVIKEGDMGKAVDKLIELLRSEGLL